MVSDILWVLRMMDIQRTSWNFCMLFLLEIHNIGLYKLVM